MKEIKMFLVLFVVALGFFFSIVIDGIKRASIYVINPRMLAKIFSISFIFASFYIFPPILLYKLGALDLALWWVSFSIPGSLFFMPWMIDYYDGVCTRISGFIDDRSDQLTHPR